MKDSSVHHYDPVLCGTSELLAFPRNDFEKLEYLCFEPAELEFDILEILELDDISVKARLKYGQLNEMTVTSQNDTVRVAIDSQGPKVTLVQGALETTLPFGSQTVTEKLSTASFPNFTYIYFDEFMIGVEIRPTFFNFEIGKRSENFGFPASKPRAKESDLHCFGRQISSSHCSNHDLVPLAIERPRSSRGRKRKVTLGEFESALDRQL